jgi:hypothetical protein
MNRVSHVQYIFIHMIIIYHSEPESIFQCQKTYKSISTTVKSSLTACYHPNSLLSQTYPVSKTCEPLKHIAFPTAKHISFQDLKSSIPKDELLQYHPHC